MRLDLKEYNIISKDEFIIGFIDDVIKLYKDYAKQIIDDMLSKEELLEVYTLLENLINATSEEYDVFLVKVYCHPMGAYQFKKVEL